MIIDTIYQTLLTILSKDNQGYVTPTEFNRIAALVQNQIFREYFVEEGKEKHNQNRGKAHEGYGNLVANIQRRVADFAANGTLTQASGVYPLPTDIYFVEDNGVSLSSNGVVVDEVERAALTYMLKSSLTSPTTLFPVYENLDGEIKVYPSTITGTLNCRYIRKPSDPNWTYFTLPNGAVVFDPSNASFQDFDLHESEFTNIVLKMLTYFGLAIREEEVIQTSQAIRTEENLNNQ